MEEQAIINILKVNFIMTQEEIAKQINKSLRTVKTRMMEMKEKGLIERKNGKENGIMDLKIKTEKEEFHGRTCGIIKQENKFLIMRVNKSSYYHIPGGHIEIGEDSEQAVIREIKEEIGCDVQDINLFAIQENFWTRNNKKCHGIEFYYIIKLKQQLQMKDYERIENDKGEEKLLEFKWVTSKELKDIDLRPTNIRDMLINEEYLKGLTHIVKKG